ncbi:hydroxyacylglutathione hydrolase [Thioclava sp. SK-1]|uniref:hydroxyacylglutathione hydrolase n=1 Tax=Thioclava sp. SK-1 TaxID=1889770 RepID=UPI0008261952|nr:hydroxyacylglutathione hydrolase [Thioclava sp. SK-1]OCX66124.1 hydroxyacylglutathione hydrolase [Thioclava sp. SK-1]
MPVELSIIPCLSDNYAYILHDPGTDTTCVVDVPDAAPIMSALNSLGYKLNHILLTHHHDDHIAGVQAVASATGAKVIGAGADAHRLPSLDVAVGAGDTIKIGTEEVEVLEVPGHTVGHIAYVFPQSYLLFSGDSLMSWGCGRLFEGSPTQMFGALERLAQLPDEMLICSGHEYTEANGKFALHLEPDNRACRMRMRDTLDRRAQKQPTVPSTLALEKTTNPFMRSRDPGLKAALGLPGDAAPLEVFTAARAAKDNF